MHANPATHGVRLYNVQYAVLWTAVIHRNGPSLICRRIGAFGAEWTARVNYISDDSILLEE
jgi:hypothetical protein